MKKYIIATFAAVAVFAGAAFAASLDVSAGTLQAGQDQIGTCITDDVDVAYGEATFTNPGWTVTTITLDHGGLCDGFAYSVIITGSGTGLPTASVSETFDGAVETVTFPVPFDAEGASDVHLVIRNASS